VIQAESPFRLARARRAGTQIGALFQEIHHEHGELGVRRILGVLALAKKFGRAAVEDACATAVALGGHLHATPRFHRTRESGKLEFV